MMKELNPISQRKAFIKMKNPRSTTQNKLLMPTSIKNPNQNSAHVHYAESAMPQRNASHGFPGARPEGAPKQAYTHVPRL